jgi:hypothetical protein
MNFAEMMTRWGRPKYSQPTQALLWPQKSNVYCLGIKPGPCNDCKQYRPNSLEVARFEVFNMVKIQVKVFWVVILYSDAVGYQCFGGPCCLQLQGEVTMETARLSEMLVSYSSTIWHHDPEALDLNLQKLCSHIYFLLFGSFNDNVSTACYIM